MSRYFIYLLLFQNVLTNAIYLAQFFASQTAVAANNTPEVSRENPIAARDY